MPISKIASLLRPGPHACTGFTRDHLQCKDRLVMVARGFLRPGAMCRCQHLVLRTTGAGAWQAAPQAGSPSGRQPQGGSSWTSQHGWWGFKNEGAGQPSRRQPQGADAFKVVCAARALCFPAALQGKWATIDATQPSMYSQGNLIEGEWWHAAPKGGACVREPASLPLKPASHMRNGLL